MATSVEKNDESGSGEKEKNSAIFIDVPIIPEIGIIYPPAEIRNIIDKTAEFVFKNGIEFEEKIRNKEAQNPKFTFLNRNDPYFKYYKHVYYDFTLYPHREKAAAKPSFLPTSGVKTETKPEVDKNSLVNKHRTIIDISDPTFPSDSVQPFEFFTEQPPLAPLDMDIVRVTAQFVAKNGRSFLQSLLQRETKNYIFDFLKPQHNIYPFFIKLVDQYHKILFPSEDMLAELTQTSQSNVKILEQVRHRFEWIRYNDKERRRELDKNLKEKNLLNSIDWHEFVVVETISFRWDEKNNLPPPVTVEQLGARLIAQERYEKIKESQPSFPEQKEPEVEQVVAEDVEPPAKIPPPKIIDIKKATDDSKTAKTKSTDKMMISPITGELIPASKLDEHIRFSLLDPRYKEQKQKFEEEKRQLDLMASSGPSVSAHLKDLANRRSDIFGPGHAETVIGEKLNEKEVKYVKKSAPVNFDNKYTPSSSQPKVADNKHKLPPPLPSRAVSTPNQRVELPPPLPTVNSQYPPPSSASYGSYQSSSFASDGRPKFDEELIPANQFLESYGGAPIHIQVRIPQLPELVQKHNWNLQGQIEHFSINLSDTIASLKAQIQQRINMPPSKQKILIGATRFGKDNTSLAFYNVHSNTYVALHLKERGGKR